MDDLIRRQDAIDCVSSARPMVIRSRIASLPKVDIVPVRHAKWIEHEWAEESEGLLIPNYECTECHTWERNESDYCPHCGAKMDG